jgi:hypothetical protein
MLVTEEDIASSFEVLDFHDLFFFFGSFWGTTTIRTNLGHFLRAAPNQY